ncbi:hypothetical protein [Pseudomonas sp. Tri1]|uniref:hypothetical protein n=1 Tax=Pseudomonas sp. Tri1 TaxID=2823875 RepID=UPI001B31BBFC|nr:hypothetical protein [Pseudomonas sp. Tri1]
MPEIADYMSWNIESLSSRKCAKDVFRNVNVAAWIAVLIDEMQANVIGVMEVTLGTGEQAVQVLVQAINDRKKLVGSGSKWKYEVSQRNIEVAHTFARRADKYALLWDDANVNVSNMAVAASTKVIFADRNPLFWNMQAKTAGKPKELNCLLWHAPQPKYHKKDATIQLLADLTEEIEINTGNTTFLISGDFNYDTANAATYAPLTSLKFSGIFDGEKTTLTSLKSFVNDIVNREKMIQRGDVDDAFLASAYDNIFIRGITSNWELKVCVPNVVLQEIMDSFTFMIVTRMQLQLAMKNAKIISDHMPIVMTLEE